MVLDFDSDIGSKLQAVVDTKNAIINELFVYIETVNKLLATRTASLNINTLSDKQSYNIPSSSGDIEITCYKALNEDKREVLRLMIFCEFAKTKFMDQDMPPKRLGFTGHPLPEYLSSKLRDGLSLEKSMYINAESIVTTIECRVLPHIKERIEEAANSVQKWTTVRETIKESISKLEELGIDA